MIDFSIPQMQSEHVLTFVAREPAVSLSRNTGIAKGPKVGVAVKAPL